jgi:DNA (cytosine-5)-methyltransferase 1
MAENFDIFDLMEEDGLKYKPIKSTDWKWTMKDDYPKEKNGLKVFSCFACGGGSTMGYKLAGCEVIGCCEIDPKMNEVYIKNHHPKHNFLMDIRKFNEIPNEELPEELFKLDILDGSPPCTTFSMAGDREESWGKKKKFREGQAEQTLDDLSFVFIDTVAKLRPKVMIMENVEGLIKGEAWSYVQKIYKQLKDIGYTVKHWILKGENMGVPQKRHRVFFIAVRKDVSFDLERLDMSFNYIPIPYSEIECDPHNIKEGKIAKLARMAKQGDINLLRASREFDGKNNFFSERVQCKSDVLWAIAAGGSDIWVENFGYCINDVEMAIASTFPQDYNFGKQKVKYICGMSVPPIMIKRIVTRLIESGVFK